MAGAPPTREFFIATPEEIRAGLTSDVYFFRTLEVLKKARKDRTKVVNTHLGGFATTNDDALAAYDRAIGLTGNVAERQLLGHRRTQALAGRA